MSHAGRKRQWRCFHCDEVFANERCAADHFGVDETKTAACQLKSFEGHLVAYIRKLEMDLDQYRAEDSCVLRSLYSMTADHRQELIRAEEDGYSKGVRDMEKQGVGKFALAILHGDDLHRQWLLDAAAAFEDGLPIPEQRTEKAKP